MIIEINKFNDILFSYKKTLVLCDIDNTILYFDKNINYFYSFIKDNMINLNEEYVSSESIRLYNLYINNNYAKHTDYNGFNQMLNNKNINIIFLTSRHITSIELTKKNFNHIGLNYDDFIVHYTNYETTKLNKGEYLLNNMIDLNNYEEIIFIDDSDFCLESVNRLFPNIKCYKFINKYIYL
jgi:hypothetical protein